MTDRRPPELLVVDDCGHEGFHYDNCMEPRSATFDEVLAHVRRGVESGTIKGEVVRAVPVSGRYHRYEVGLENPGDYIVIGPVSDGGEDR